MQFTLDGLKINDRKGLFDQIRDQLPVPDYLGNNLDALHDYLTESHDTHLVTIHHFRNLVEALGGHYIVRMLTMLTDSGCQIKIQ